MQRLTPENRRSFNWSGWKTLLLPQLNRRSLFVYGSEVAVEKECIRQKEGGVLVIHPFSRLRSYYIMCMVAITFLNLIGIPMEIAFLDGNSGVGWEGFNVFSDTLFLIDVGVNFRMGIIPEDCEEILITMCSALVRKIPILRNCDINFINGLLVELQYEVYQEGDIIIREDTAGERMFFIEHGQVLEENEFYQRELSDGDYFGDSCLLRRGRRLATVQAQTTCQLFSLSVDSFYKVLEDYPDIKRDLEKSQQKKDLLL